MPVNFNIIFEHSRAKELLGQETLLSHGFSAGPILSQMLSCIVNLSFVSNVARVSEGLNSLLDK